MGNEWLVLGMIGGFLGLMVIGIPVAIALAVSGFVAGYLGFGPMLFQLMPARLFGVVTNYTLLAIPLFVFMGVMLEKSRVAEDMLETIGKAMGGVNGGMGLAIILVGVLMGASTGIVGATVVTVGLLTLPALQLLELRSDSFNLRCHGAPAVAMPPPLTALERSVVTAEWRSLADVAPVESVSI